LDQYNGILEAMTIRNYKILRENNRIEVKQAIKGLPHSIWETYSAFANTQGGLIILGAEELTDKSIKTVLLSNPDKLVPDFWNTVNNQKKISVNILHENNVQIVEEDVDRPGYFQCRGLEREYPRLLFSCLQ
jgi:predicted HTH transcriptional regulator